MPLRPSRRACRRPSFPKSSCSRPRRLPRPRRRRRPRRTDSRRRRPSETTSTRHVGRPVVGHRRTPSVGDADDVAVTLGRRPPTPPPAPRRLRRCTAAVAAGRRPRLPPPASTVPPKHGRRRRPQCLRPSRGAAVVGCAEEPPLTTTAPSSSSRRHRANVPDRRGRAATPFERRQLRRHRQFPGAADSAVRAPKTAVTTIIEVPAPAGDSGGSGG